MFSYIFMKIFESSPRNYDRLMQKASLGRIKAIKASVATEISDQKRVLEIGCGTGELAAMMVANGANVDAFDVNPGMIKVARQRISSNHLENHFTLRMMGVDGMDGLADSTYDAVVSVLVFSELSDDERRFALKHAFRVLKPGGLMVIADEVMPRNLFRKVLYRITRIPMLMMTYLISRSTTQPISDLSGELIHAGFIIEKENRSHGDAFAIVISRRVKGEMG